jgi:hypothetical protein
VVTILSAAELEAVSGGVQALEKIKCTATVSISPNMSCTGSAADFWGVGVAAFNQLQTWGGQLGGWIYDVTH